jgi:succinoglycan biosynthesis transport protein ExoP
MTPAPFENAPASAEASATTPFPQQAGPDTTLSDAWMTIRKRRYIILAAVLLAIAFAFYQMATRPRLYQATGSIQIRSGSSNEFRVGVTALGPTNSQIPTQVAILKSESLLYSVARDLNLANDPDFMGLKTRNPHVVNIDDPVVRQNVLIILANAITVTAVPKTDIIHITCETLRADLSAAIVNTLIEEYRDRSLQTSADFSKRVSKSLSAQLGDLQQEVKKSPEQVIALQKRLGVLGFDPTHNQITSNLDDLSRAAEQAQLNRIMAEVRYHVLTGMNRTYMDETVDPNSQSKSPSATSQLPALRGQLDTARASLAQLTATLGPNHPQVKAVRAQIAELEKVITQEQDRVLAQARENLVAAQTEENQTRAALETEEAGAYKLRDDLVDYTIAQRDYESSRTLYEGLLQRLRSAGVEAGLESTEIDIIDSAIPPVNPSLKPRSTILLIDTMIGLILGLIIAFVLESLDTGLNTVAEIEAISGLPSLALIPRIRRAPEAPNMSPALRNLRVLSSPKSQFAESFRALRTSLLLSTASHEPQVILLTSATPSEGKTTVSINLACVLAQRDVRVLLIDADLRRPTVHHRFGLNGKAGLTSVLTGSIPLAQAVQNIADVPNLDVLVSGPVPPFPTEMLGSETMRQLLEQARGTYTHIVMDSPPLLSVTDSVVLARDSDAVVLIVRHGKSGKHTVRRARDLLLRAGAQVTGIALNAVDLNSPEYYSYYGYYGYAGYGSAGVDSAAWEAQSGNGKNSGSAKAGKQ